MMNEPKLTLYENSSAGKGSRPPQGESAGSFEPHTAAKINQLDADQMVTMGRQKRLVVGSIPRLTLGEDFLDS